MLCCSRSILKIFINRCKDIFVPLLSMKVRLGEFYANLRRNCRPHPLNSRFVVGRGDTFGEEETLAPAGNNPT
jgi:hypothetical protein